MAESEEWLLPIRPIATPPDVAAALAAAERPQHRITIAPPDTAPVPTTREEIDAFVARHHNSRPVPDLLRRS